MKNLFVETQSTVLFNDSNSLPYENYQCCYNFDKNIYYFVECDENLIHLIDLVNGTHSVKRILVESNKSKPVGIEYSSTEEEIYVAYECGNVYEISAIDDDDDFNGKEVAEFDTGLYCMKISPDNEAIAFITKDLHVTVITCKYFDCLNSINLLAAEFGEKQFISVGWGKKETQFHGSEGKNAAKAKPSIFRKANTDNNLPKITWNESSTLFAVSFIDESSNARRFKVIDRKGILQYTSELVDCLEGTLAWKGSDNLIASTRKLPNKHTVALFTKNGLLHREFTLPFNSDNIYIQDLIWSRDSDILGIWYKDITSGLKTLQLWSQNNYHWYLKQTITYPKKNPILYTTWSPQIDKDLLILSSKSSIIYTFYWAVSHSHGKEESDKAVVSVINGDQVYITKFRYFIIPPPMCQQTLQFKQTVNAISFSPIDSENSENNSNDFLVLLANNKIVLCKEMKKSEKLENSQYIYKTYNIDLKIKNANKYSLHLIQHLFWYKQDFILCSVSLGEKSSLYELHLLHIDALDEILIDARLVHEMPGKIQHIIASADSKNAYIIVNNQVYIYNQRDGLSKSDVVISNEKFSRTVVKIESVNFGDKEVIVALTRNNVLYANGNQITNNVTSFFVHSDTLIITTQQHTLISFELNSSGFNQLCTKDLTFQPWENKSNLQELNIRRIERGSALIVVVPKNDRTVLQMPRGNLETIQHRALSITIIKPLLDRHNYKEALRIMRRQQMDYNLFYDHDPHSFMNNAEKFIKDFDVRSLTVFLTELNDDDVTQTIYKNSYGDRTKQEMENSQKIDMVCQTLRSLMERNANKYIEPIIITLVKKQDLNGIEKALKKLYQLSKSEDTDDVQEKLCRMNFMVNKKSLFDIALGTYDLELTLFVAEATRNNSRETLDFLNSFKEFDSDYMKYKIDIHLKRYTSALRNIAKLPTRFEDCMKLIREHDLYSEGLKLFANNRTGYLEIASAYANILEAKGKYQDAGILYAKANEMEKALVAYKKANCWQQAIAAAFKLRLSVQGLNNLFRDLVEQLVKENKYNEAATVLSKYSNKFEDSIAILCKGKEWLQALTESCCMNREDLIESHVRPSVLEHAEFLLGHLRRCRQDFSEHTNRLVTVRPGLTQRRRAIDDLANPLSAAGDGANAVTDRYRPDYPESSIADSTETRSSQVSRSSSRTYRSSKNRRKHERKTYSIKKGSLYEDLGLIRTLHQLVSQAYEQRDNVRSIVEILLHLNSDELAEELHKELNVFLGEIRCRKHEIWPPIHENSNLRESFADDAGREKQHCIDHRILFAPEETSINWKLDVFSPLVISD